MRGLVECPLYPRKRSFVFDQTNVCFAPKADIRLRMIAIGV
jgi:hypothetical protein